MPDRFDANGVCQHGFPKPSPEEAFIQSMRYLKTVTGWVDGDNIPDYVVAMEHDGGLIIGLRDLLSAAQDPMVALAANRVIKEPGMLTGIICLMMAAYNKAQSDKFIHDMEDGDGA